MANIFNKIKLKRPNYSHFDLSHDHKLSLKMGKLVPITLQETLPGDVFKMSSEAMFRLMPLISPMMHKVDVYIHYFYVPNRIVWPNWNRFIFGNEDGSADPPPAFPILNKSQSYNCAASSLPNYLGLPVGGLSAVDEDFSALPFAAYQRIYHEYYRDQNLQSSPPIELIDGEQTMVQSDELLVLRDRAWEHDYFTSCLPFAQKGQPVDVPFQLANDVDVKSKNDGSHDTYLYDVATQNPFPNATGIETDVAGRMQEAATHEALLYNPNGDLYVDKDDFQASATINDLRSAFSLQKWLEKNARAGSRAVEALLAHFGVKSSDARLQRPEYLGGSKANVAISEVLQTSESDGTAQGNMAGHGISVSGGNEFKYYCEEHGLILGILSIRPKTAYYQGIPKIFSKTIDKFQYFWQEFAFLGEQEVLNKEVYYDQADSDYNNGTFGYIPRYSEYRFNNSRVSGQMATTLEFWHMARKFGNQQHLNSDFITCDPTKRVFAVEDPDEDEIVAHIYQKIHARRPLPKEGNPGSI